MINFFCFILIANRLDVDESAQLYKSFYSYERVRIFFCFFSKIKFRSITFYIDRLPIYICITNIGRKNYFLKHLI